MELRDRWYNLAAHLYCASDIATIPPPSRVSDLRESAESIQERKDRAPERAEPAVPRPDKGSKQAAKPRPEKSKLSNTGTTKSEKKAKQRGTIGTDSDSDDNHGSPLRPTVHSCGIVCKNQHACVETNHR
jgi:hypothetical protein